MLKTIALLLLAHVKTHFGLLNFKVTH